VEESTGILFHISEIISVIIISGLFLLFSIAVTVAVTALYAITNATGFSFVPIYSSFCIGRVLGTIVTTFLLLGKLLRRLFRLDTLTFGLEFIVGVNDLLVLLRIVSIPSITLALIVQVNILDNLIRSYVLSSPLGALLAWSFGTKLGRVCHGTTILTGTFAEFGGSRPLELASIIPGTHTVVGVSLLVLFECVILLMLQAWVGRVQIPRGLFNILGDMGVDVFSFLIDLWGKGTRLTGLLQLLLFLPLVSRLPVP
jgi:hypothetical protein